MLCYDVARRLHIDRESSLDASNLASAASESRPLRNEHVNLALTQLTMGKKRKRPGKSRQEHSPTARSQPRITASASPGRLKYPNPPVTRNKPNHTAHPVISLYYREVLTLRHYLLRQLPTSSKSRRRRIASLGSSTVPEHGETKPLSDLLDATLVGVLKQPSPKVDSERQRDYRAFTQSQSRSVLVSTDTGPTSPQSEVWLRTR